MTNESKPVTTLTVPTAEIVREELKVEAPLVAKDDLDAKAEAFVEALLSTDPTKHDELAEKRDAAEKFGAEEQGNEEARWEVVTIEKKSLDDRLFLPPADYKKQDMAVIRQQSGDAMQEGRSPANR